jgi:hypothetical protein
MNWFSFSIGIEGPAGRLREVEEWLRPAVQPHDSDCGLRIDLLFDDFEVENQYTWVLLDRVFDGAKKTDKYIEINDEWLLIRGEGKAMTPLNFAKRVASKWTDLTVRFTWSASDDADDKGEVWKFRGEEAHLLPRQAVDSDKDEPSLRTHQVS